MNNVYSCRKIEERLLRDVHFIWLAGYEHRNSRGDRFWVIPKQNLSP